MKKGFSNEKYLLKQKIKVLDRVKRFNRLYLEIGGKLSADNHAARVLPGYKKTNKIELIKSLKHFGLIYCVNAKDLQSEKTLGKKRRNYQKQVLKDLSDLKKYKINISAVVITRYSKEKAARDFREVLEKKKLQVSIHNEIVGYPKNNILKGLSSQPYIPIENSLIIITGPAGGSGKMAVAMSQIYHEIKQKKKVGFAKFETFPIWNLDLNHPINIAYEAATANLQDENQIDFYHKKAYKKIAVNYNRDIENFKILRKISQKITKKKIPFGYKSPTDMGLNEIKAGIINEEVCSKAAIKEIKRRDKEYKKEYKKGREDKKTLIRMEEVIAKLNFIYGEKP
ncbi:DUF1846 family protein [archaeon]|jgi:uncharacterized protein (UPF0371 family)|nr:DUF1846 family protein [archaeon]